jgi:hypothetical protein
LSCLYADDLEKKVMISNIKEFIIERKNNQERSDIVEVGRHDQNKETRP